MTDLSKNRPTKLLLVDDRPENLLALEAALHPLGQELVSVSSGEEALRYLLTDEFAAILLDVQMPGMDGFDTAAQIKQRERSRHIPIIFLTAISREMHQQLRGYEVGAVDYIAKPFDPWVLRSKVAVFIELHNKSRLLQEQAVQLGLANAELEQFAEIVSHDLRTPLVAISGYLQLLRELGPEERDFVKRALSSAEQMARLIDDLLGYARAGKAIGPLRSFDAADALERAVANLRGQLDEAGARVESGKLPVIAADGPQLTRLLQNLIGNSLKYRHPERQLKVTVAAAREGPAWVFSVVDNGRGLPEGDDDIFAMFQRGAAAAGTQGTGIGLAICKKIVEGHGGRIWADSSDSGGAAFHFTIPEGTEFTRPS